MTTKVLTEGKHAEEFLCSEGNGSISREVGTVTSGQKFPPGRVLKLSGGKLVVATGSNSSGVSDEAIVGVSSFGADASATGTNADIVNKEGGVYIARNAEVKLAGVVLHEVSGGGLANANTAVKAALKALNIILR